MANISADISETIVTQVRIQGFRSLKDITINLDPVTVLVGRNGSGKSSIVDALYFLQEAILISPDSAFRRCGGYHEVRTNLGKMSGKDRESEFVESIALDISLRSRAENLFSSQYFVRFGLDEKQQPVVLNESGEVVIGIEGERHSFDVEKGKWIKSVNGVEPSIASNRLALPLLSGLTNFLPLYNALTSIRYYDISPQAVAAPHEPDPGLMLARDGSNAASVLRRIEKEDKALFTKVVETLALIMPSIRKVTYKELGRDVTIAFEERISSRRIAVFDARNMSEGTLRALAVLLAIYALEPSATIILEEPERAIHPGAAAAIAEAIKEAGQRTQILVTTHSPDLITYFDVDSLRAVQRENGFSLAGPIRSDQLEAIKDSLFNAGEIHRFEGLSPSS